MVLPPGADSRATLAEGNYGPEVPTVAGNLAAAILEFNPQRLPGKLQKAEEAIADRMQELSFTENNQQERRLLCDGLSIIQDLRKERLGLGADDR